MGRGQLPAQRRHLAQGRGLAAALSRHPHPPAPGRAAARRQPGAPLLHRHQPFRPRRRQRSRPDPLAPSEGRYHRACPRRADERTRRRRLAQSKVWRQRRLAAPQRDPLQPALGLQARRPTRGISYRQTQAATLLAAQHRRQGRPPCPRDPPALHQGDRPSPRRSAANPLRPQTPRLSRGLRRAIRRGLGVRTQYLRCADDVAATRSGISPHIDLSRSALNSKVWSFTLAPTAMSRRTLSLSAASPPIAVEANQGVKAILQPPVNLADGDKAAIIQGRWRPHLGVMLSAFGVFWTGEGLGIAWPGQDLSLLLFAAFVSQSGSDWRFARA